ncbi:MAG: hypothetical protein BV456_01690 [Thermoplasmata archaeon M8B2D]|nr:MAG: hypothetical protein BV456_01690 [Thermoplasmata archaeon M8B2D]
MQIFEYDEQENLLREITEIIGEEKLNEYGIKDDEDLVRFALNYLLSNIDDVEDFFYEVE